jgi:hypothetical protein
MTKLERARRFFSGNARSALRVISLAALAAGAYAQTTIFNAGTPSFFSAAGGSSSGHLALTSNNLSVISTGPDINGIEGLSIFGSMQVACQGNASCGGESFDINFAGGVSGSFIPDTGIAKWLFNGSGGYYWSLLGGSGSASGGQAISGSSPFSIFNNSGSGSWSFSLSIQPFGLTSPGDTMTVFFPSGATVDIGTDQTPPAASPEPSSVLLAMAGGSAILFLRRKRRA